MFEVPAYFPLLSVYLSRVLDEIGLDELTVRTGKCHYLQAEALGSVGDQLAEAYENNFFFGSQPEGTTVKGLESDIDKLSCHQDYNAIQQESEREIDKINVLMLNNSMPPGYVQLQDESLNGNPNLLPNSCLLIQPPFVGGNREVHGPAVKFVDPLVGYNIDEVTAIKCKSWPVQAIDWLNKRRPGHWPSQKMLRYAEMTGCFLVPVGHRLSSPEMKDYEFRISPSLTERCLIFSFNMTQIKCYVTLKIISKLFLKPATTDGISSFHLKNIMFYMIENMRPKMWKEIYLLQCITTGLFVLLELVINGYCPNYIIPRENLFAGRITKVEQTRLLHKLTLLIKSKGCFLFQIDTDRIGQLLREKLLVHPSCIHVDSDATAMMYAYRKYFVHEQLQADLLYAINGGFHFSRREYQYAIAARAIRLAIQDAIRSIRKLRKSFVNDTQLLSKAILYLTPMLCSYLGSLMSSICICYNQPVPHEAMYWFGIGTHSDVTSSHLKRASAYICSGDFQSASAILTAVEEEYNHSNIQPVCGCCYENIVWVEETIQNLFEKRQPSNKLMAHCVVFSRQEFYCVPFALQYEMFRSKDKSFSKYEDRYMDMAIIDSLPFFYYLQFITYKKLGESERMGCALDMLIECLMDDFILFHKMTTLNLLGHCMELEQRHGDAIVYYVKSLKLRPIDNVAKWLLSLVLFKMHCCNTLDV